MNPLWLDLLEPYILSKLIGHDKVPMFFWGPIIGPGVVKKKGWLLRYEIKNLFATVDLIFSFIDLEPDGCLVADQFRIRT